MITVQHSEEFLSLAAINAIAAIAGVELGCSIHDYGIDGTIQEMRDDPFCGKIPSLTIDYQLKASINWKQENGYIIYDLNVKNYNKLISRLKDKATNVPFLLILLCLPKKQEEWLSVCTEEIILRKCCYWYTVSDSENYSNNKDKIRIKIPDSNIFLPETVIKMFEDRRGKDEF